MRPNFALLGIAILFIAGCSQQALDDAGAARRACIDRAASGGDDRSNFGARYIGLAGEGRHLYNVRGGGSRSYNCIVNDDAQVVSFGRV